MRRGRRRQFDPTIPGHIPQDKLPVGIYWDRRDKTWYRLSTGPDGRRRRENVARADAKLSELAAIAEAAGGDAAGTLAFALARFHESDKCLGLAATTRRGYEQCRRWLCDYPTRAGDLGTLQVDRLSRPLVQQLLDKVASTTPTKANAMLRYARRALRWAMNRGHCRTNPFDGLEAAQERAEHRMPESDALVRALAFARERGGRQAYTAGSVAPYLWVVIELAYRCRMRSIEVLDLTLASADARGIQVVRRKGSKDNVTLWTPHLRAVWDAALAMRAATLARIERKRKGGVVESIQPGKRALILSDDGSPLTIHGLRAAWQRFMRLASGPEGPLAAAERFSLHGLKHRGITDTERGDKRAGGGHVSDSIAARYDHDVPAVKPAGE